MNKALVLLVLVLWMLSNYFITTNDDLPVFILMFYMLVSAFVTIFCVAALFKDKNNGPTA